MEKIFSEIEKTLKYYGFNNVRSEGGEIYFFDKEGHKYSLCPCKFSKRNLLSPEDGWRLEIYWDSISSGETVEDKYPFLKGYYSLLEGGEQEFLGVDSWLSVIRELSSLVPLPKRMELALLIKRGKKLLKDNFVLEENPDNIEGDPYLIRVFPNRAFGGRHQTRIHRNLVQLVVELDLAIDMAESNPFKSEWTRFELERANKISYWCSSALYHTTIINRFRHRLIRKDKVFKNF